MTRGDGMLCAMKKLIPLFAAVALVAACDSATETPATDGGTTPDTDTSVATDTAQPSDVAMDVGLTPPDVSATDVAQPVDAADVAPDTGAPVVFECVIGEGEDPDYIQSIGCPEDFETLANRPLNGSIPGAKSAKTIIDRAGNFELYFLNAERFPIHYTFAKQYLSGQGLPIVGDMGTFSQTEYYSPNRRFLLGAITYYEEPGVWAYEIAPYDTSLPDMVVAAYDQIREAVFFGGELYFHPTSEPVEKLAKSLPEHVLVKTSKELFANVTYQPLNLGTTIGQLRFFNVTELEAEVDFVTPRDLAVLDRVPNDISVVAGLITAELQTPLSHVNVLSQNRGTPNMALVGAMESEKLRALEGKWVKLKVDAFEWTIVEVSKEEADAWWEEHKPPAVKVPALDLSVTDLRDCAEISVEDIPAFGGKASNYGVLTKIGDKVPVRPAFAVPVFYYKQFEQQNGFDKTIKGLLESEQFNNDVAYRQNALATLQKAMKKADVDPTFLAMITDKVNAEYPGQAIRFRSSTNAEDLDGFTGAGLYTSQGADLLDPSKPVIDAVRGVWASLWNFRAFEERSYRGIDHTGVSMAILVHQGFPKEDAQGVALTGNIFDDVEPAFYVNVQVGDISVVLPPPGVTTDQFLYYFTYPGQPITFIGHSNLIPDGETVLTGKETYTLGVALDAIHKAFAPYYQKSGAFYAMDVEFKFNLEPGTDKAQLWVKQARPHPGWAQGVEP